MYSITTWDWHIHRKIFSKYYWIKPKSDCIYHLPIDLEHQTDSVRLVPNQSENGTYNLISVWFNNISVSFPCAPPENPSTGHHLAPPSRFAPLPKGPHRAGDCCSSASIADDRFRSLVLALNRKILLLLSYNICTQYIGHNKFLPIWLHIICLIFNHRFFSYLEKIFRS